MDIDLAPETAKWLEELLGTALLQELKSPEHSDEAWNEMQNLLYSLHNSATVHINKRSSF